MARATATEILSGERVEPLRSVSAFDIAEQFTRDRQEIAVAFAADEELANVGSVRPDMLVDFKKSLTFMAGTEVDPGNFIAWAHSQDFELSVSGQEVNSEDEDKIQAVREDILGNASAGDLAIELRLRREGKGDILLRINGGAQSEAVQTITRYGNKDTAVLEPEEVLAYQGGYRASMPFLANGADEKLSSVGLDKRNLVLRIPDDLIASGSSSLAERIALREMVSRKGIEKDVVDLYAFEAAIGTLQGLIVLIVDAMESESATVIDVGAISTGLSAGDESGQGMNYIVNSPQLTKELADIGLYTAGDAGQRAIQIPAELLQEGWEVKYPWNERDDGYTVADGEAKLSNGLYPRDEAPWNNVTSRLKNGALMVRALQRDLSGGDGAAIGEDVVVQAKRANSEGRATSVAFEGIVGLCDTMIERAVSLAKQRFDAEQYEVETPISMSVDVCATEIGFPLQVVQETWNVSVNRETI